MKLILMCIVIMFYAFGFTHAKSCELLYEAPTKGNNVKLNTLHIFETMEVKYDSIVKSIWYTTFEEEFEPFYVGFWSWLANTTYQLQSKFLVTALDNVTMHEFSLNQSADPFLVKAGYVVGIHSKKPTCTGSCGSESRWRNGPPIKMKQSLHSRAGCLRTWIGYRDDDGWDNSTTILQYGHSVNLFVIEFGIITECENLTSAVVPSTVTEPVTVTDINESDALMTQTVTDNKEKDAAMIQTDKDIKENDAPMQNSAETQLQQWLFIVTTFILCIM